MSLKGVEAGPFKHGGYSKHLPPHLASIYAAGFNDPELLSIRSEAALLEARNVILCRRLHSGESGSLWKMLRETAAEFKRCQRELQQAKASGDGDAANELAATMKLTWDSILNLIDKGASEEAAWKELILTAEKSAEFKRLEQIQLKDSQQMLSAEEAMNFIGAIMVAVQECVSSQQVRQNIAAKLQRLLYVTPRVKRADRGEWRGYKKREPESPDSGGGGIPPAGDSEIVDAGPVVPQQSEPEDGDALEI